MSTTISRPRKAKRPKSGQVPIRLEPLVECIPSPENDKLYGVISYTSPGIREMAQRMKVEGVLEPLVRTADGYIVSGHRRRCAAQLAGLREVPCRTLPFFRDDDPERFLKLLREYNRQREKTHDQRLREAIVDSDPVEVRAALIEHRRQQSHVDVAPLTIEGTKSRAAISPAKAPFLSAIGKVLQERHSFWPLSDRQIHYALLNNPPLRHASKPESVYANTPESYKSLVELLTRARLTGQVPMHAIADETRPVVLWGVHQDTSGFLKTEIDNFLKGFARDLMQSQPNHVELIGEKNTVASILREVAAEYTIPLTTGRGYCSLPPRAAIANRYRKSGRAKLVLLLVSDFDPDGEEIAHSFARSLRDDFSIANVHPIKVALTADQVEEYELPPVMKAKETSVHHAKFTERHGDDVFELEALPPATLQDVVRDAIDNVIDVDAFNAEIDREAEDAVHLDGVRRSIHEYLKGVQT